MSAGRRVVLGIGANLDDRLAALQGAVDALAGAPGVWIEAVSGVFETDPVGGPEQPRFLNAIVVLRTDIEPADLLARVHEIEQAWHRTREVRWGPRTLDIDIVDVCGVRSDDPVLTLPHPRAAERAFVLVPWLQVDPDAVLTGIGPIRDLVVDSAGVHATAWTLVLP